MSYLRIGLIAAALLATTWLGIKIEQSGYNRALASQVKREAEIAKGFVIAIKESEINRSAALDELNKLRSRPPVVITDVQTEIIERNVCKRFDAEFIGLLDAT
jgi:hypothetical protein